jgi:uncharacterized DUF497 family protein
MNSFRMTRMQNDFEQATGVFRNPLALSRYDEDHGEGEERWLTLGVNETGELLVVSHTSKEFSEQEARVRLISHAKPPPTSGGSAKAAKGVARAKR